jgi:hypothetical protein
MINELLTFPINWTQKWRIPRKQEKDVFNVT